MKQDLLYIALILAFFITPISAFSQLPDSGKKEISLSTTSLSFNGLSLEFKKELRNDRYFHIGLIDVYGSYQNTMPGEPTIYKTSRIDLSVGIVIGIEKRKSLSESLKFIYGPNLNLSSDFMRRSIENPTLPESVRNLDTYMLSPGVSYTLGFIYQFKNNFGFGAMFTPGFYYTQTWYESGGENMDIDYNLNFNGSTKNIRISLLYSW